MEIDNRCRSRTFPTRASFSLYTYWENGRYADIRSLYIETCVSSMDVDSLQDRRPSNENPSSGSHVCMRATELILAATNRSESKEATLRATRTKGLDDCIALYRIFWASSHPAHEVRSYKFINNRSG